MPIRARAIATIHPAPGPSDAEVAAALATIRHRVQRLLVRHGLEPADEATGPADRLAEESPVLAEIVGASVQGRVALGQRAGARVRRLGDVRDTPTVTSRGPRQAHVEGFDLHANVWVSAQDRAGLERLSRYVLRPPFAQERLRLRSDGRVALAAAHSSRLIRRDRLVRLTPRLCLGRLSLSSPGALGSRGGWLCALCLRLQRPIMGGYVTLTGPQDGASAAGGRSCCLRSHEENRTMFAILGATGKVGRATIGKLRAQGRAVRAVVRNAAKGRDLLDLGCELVVADLRDVASLQAALRDSEAVQLIIPMGVQALDAGAETHALVAAICSAVAAARPAHVLAISDYGAELDAPTGVTRLFHDFEQQLSALDMRLTFLRSAEHMQNWARHIKYAAETGLLPSMHQPNGKLFPTVSAHDVGEASAEFLLRAADENAGPCIVHVEGPRRYTPTDVAAAMSSVLGRPVVAQDPGRSKWLTSLVRGGLSESYAKLVVELYDAHNAGLIDVENGVGELRHGRTPLEEVLRTLAASAGKSAG